MSDSGLEDAPLTDQERAQLKRELDEEFEKLNSSPSKDQMDSWKNKFRRIARRSYIASQMIKPEVSLEEIKSNVRAVESSKEISGIPEILIDEEFVIDEASYEIAQRASEEVVNSFTEVEAVVLLGSAVHGGAEVSKKISENFTDSDPAAGDVDWGVIINTDISQQRQSEMVTEMNRVLGRIFHNSSGMKMRSCRISNAKIHRTENLENADSVLEMMTYGKITKIYKLLLYFQPSVPPEVNQRNSRLVLEGLKSLYKKDTVLWRLVVSSMLVKWREMHGLKVKHLGARNSHITAKRSSPDQSNRSKKLRREVAQESGIIMGERLKMLLLSTADSGQTEV